jgi:ABC-type lipoprotein export system ATPase subunit
MITVENVTKTYSAGRTSKPVTALREVTLHIAPGSFLVITGRSGSGKTTLLNLIAGLSRPTSGRVSFQGKDWWKLADRSRSLERARKVGFIFQFPSLLPSLNSLENVALPMMFDPRQDWKSSYARARQLLQSLEVGDKAAAYPRQLSAGQQQRVVIARALFHRPELLLADEPTSDLDEQTECEIMELLKQIHATTATTIVLVTHSSQLVRYGTQSLKMANGQIVASPVSGNNSQDLSQTTAQIEAHPAD